ncbi:MAG: hypothetical protein DMD58_04725, partial [Gemmatimonadetes bacterium]
MQQIRRSAAIPEQLRVTRAPSHLRGEFVRSESAERPIERDARAGKAILAQERRDCEGILGLGHRVKMPAIELAELLAVFAEIESQVSRKARPVGVPFLDAYMAAL